jgi:hypothetical protein
MNDPNPLVLLREAIGIAGRLAEELVRLEAVSENFWAGEDFYDLVSGFIASIKAYCGFEVEGGSPGSLLADAMAHGDRAGMSRHRFEIMSNLKALSGANRGGYMFFVFWPKLHLALTAER